MGTKKTLRIVRLRDTDLDRVVGEGLAAEILGYSKDTLRREVRAGRGPARVRLSERRVGYRLSTLYDHIEANTEK
jgi:predicted DNA-binding transcriptional regulator AlpA